MAKKKYQQIINDLSPYAQINKAFRHVYGDRAASLLSLLINKYTYYKDQGLLKKHKTKKGGTVESFFLSKLDIAWECSISLSSLEKNNNYNPIVILENLKIIKRLKSSSRKADRFVFFPNRTQKIIKDTYKIQMTDLELLKKLPHNLRREYQKALNGNSQREDIYKKYNEKIEQDETMELSFEDYLIPNEDKEASFEGLIRKHNKISLKESIKTNTNSQKIKTFNNHYRFEVTRKFLSEAINLYYEKKLDEKHIFLSLRNYQPSNKSKKWKMSKEDSKYIKENLGSASPIYVEAAIEYIDTNIERMQNGERKMRFGSLLAGIREKVIEGGQGYDSSKSPYAHLSPEEYRQMLRDMPEEKNLDYINSEL